MLQSTLKTASNFLEDGVNILSERGKTYDADDQQQERSMAKVVKVFAIITGKELTETEGWEFMACLKQVRAFQKKGFHEDSWQDFINYAALGAEAAAMQGKQVDTKKEASIGAKLIPNAFGNNLVTTTQQAAWEIYAANQDRRGYKPAMWQDLDYHDQQHWLEALAATRSMRHG